MARTLVVNPNITEEENMVNLINDANLTNHEARFIVFGYPYKIDTNPQNNPDIDNTVLTLDSTPDSKYEGGDTFTYHRIHLGKQWEVVNGQLLELKLTDRPLTHATFFNMLNSYISFRKESLDITIEADTTDPKYTLVHVLAKELSLLYINSFTARVKTTE